VEYQTRCSQCGKRNQPGVLDDKGVFTCIHCLNKADKARWKAEEAKIRNKFTEIAEWAKTQPSPIQKENEVMLAVLTELCKVPGWYRLTDIRLHFEKKINLLSKDSRCISAILKRLGFNEKRRLGGGYFNVWIDIGQLTNVNK
jgi:hypothetical protein